MSPCSVSHRLSSYIAEMAPLPKPKSALNRVQRWPGRRLVSSFMDLYNWAIGNRKHLDASSQFRWHFPTTFRKYSYRVKGCWTYFLNSQQATHFFKYRGLEVYSLVWTELKRYSKLSQAVLHKNLSNGSSLLTEVVNNNMHIFVAEVTCWKRTGQIRGYSPKRWTRVVLLYLLQLLSLGSLAAIPCDQFQNQSATDFLQFTL